jgi:hypothetical protein
LVRLFSQRALPFESLLSSKDKTKAEKTLRYIHAQSGIGSQDASVRAVLGSKLYRAAIVSGRLSNAKNTLMQALIVLFLTYRFFAFLFKEIQET